VGKEGGRFPKGENLGLVEKPEWTKCGGRTSPFPEGKKKKKEGETESGKGKKGKK